MPELVSACQSEWLNKLEFETAFVAEIAALVDCKIESADQLESSVRLRGGGEPARAFGLVGAHWGERDSVNPDILAII